MAEKAVNGGLLAADDGWWPSGYSYADALARLFAKPPGLLMGEGGRTMVDNLPQAGLPSGVFSYWDRTGPTQIQPYLSDFVRLASAPHDFTDTDGTATESVLTDAEREELRRLVERSGF